MKCKQVNKLNPTVLNVSVFYIEISSSINSSTYDEVHSFFASAFKNSSISENAAILSLAKSVNT